MKANLRLQNSLQGILTILVAVSCVLAESPPAYGPDPSAALQRVRDEVAKISVNRTPAEVRQEVDDWKRREPNSPQPYIVLANYELGLSLQPTGVYDYSTEGLKEVPTPRPGAKELSVVDPKTGKEVVFLVSGPPVPSPIPRPFEACN